MNIVDFLKYLVNNQDKIIDSPLDTKSAIIAGYSQSIVSQKGYEEEEKLKSCFKEKFPNFSYPNLKISTKSGNGKTKNGEADFIIETGTMRNGTPGPVYLFELKRNDNHDSKKRDGEVRDLKKKGEALYASYKKQGIERQIKLIIYFRYDNDNRRSEKYYKSYGIEPKYGKEILDEFIESKQEIDDVYPTLIDDEKINVCDLIDLDQNASKNVDTCIKSFSKKFIKQICDLPEPILEVISSRSSNRKFIRKLKRYIK